MEIQSVNIESIHRVNKIREVRIIDLQKYFETDENFKNNETSEKKKKKLTKEELVKVVNKSNEYTLGLDTQFEFRIHERTGRTMVRLVNKESGEILKEIPPQKMLNIVADIWDAIGINVDRKE